MSALYIIPFLGYCYWYIMVAYISIQYTLNPKRLRSILTLASSSILTPLSFYQCLRQFQQPHEIYKSYMQAQMILFYLAYCVVDTVFVNICAPNYFGLLEGWFHHIFTGIWALYYLDHEIMVAISMGMIIETSTIVMALFRIFYDANWALFLRDYVFYYMFIVFRLILPNYFMYYFYHLFADPLAVFLLGLNTLVNLYWLLKLSVKKIK